MGEENASGPAGVRDRLHPMTALLTKHCTPPSLSLALLESFSASINAFGRLLRISPPAEPCSSPLVPGATLTGKGAFLPKAALWPCSWLCSSCHPGEAPLCLAILLLNSENRGSKEPIVCSVCAVWVCMLTHSYTFCLGGHSWEYLLAPKVSCLPLPYSSLMNTADCSQD